MDDMQAYREALGRRIALTVDRYRTKSAASAAADVTVEQLNKWIAGTVKVPAEALYRLATPVDIDFCWLVSGKTNDENNENSAALPPRRIQNDVLHTVLTAIAEMQAAGEAFAPDKFADLVFALHDYLASVRARGANETGFDDLKNLIRLAAR